MSTHRSGYYKIGYTQDMAVFDTRWRRLLLALLLAIVVALPAILAEHLIYVMDLMFIAIMGALALNLLTGYAGQISLGHAAFMAVGAFLSHWLANLGLPFLIVVPLVAGAGAVLGVAVGAPALRLRGLYLVVATIGFHYIVSFLTNAYQSGGDMLQALTGLLLPPPDFGLLTLDRPRKWYFFLLLVLVMTTVFCINLARTRPGRAWIAVRDRDITAAALGINVASYKVLAFVVSSALTCMTGSLLAYFVGSVSAEYFTLTLSITYLAMVVIGGAGSILGAFLGAIFVSLLPHVITFFFEMIEAEPRIQMLFVAPSQIALFGLAMIFFLMFEPRGLVGIWGRVRTYFELWPLRQSILTEQKR
jgi:branched-chain amino acid transport system permease protein